MELKDKWYFDQLKEVHKKKLNLINSNSTKRIDNSPPTTLQISKSRVASYQNLRNQEYHEIYRKNQVILDALNEISSRKIKTQSVYSPGVKSLNINFRNKITRKIIEENELILQKLSSKGATISLKKFDEEFKLSLKYKKNLTRRLFNESPKKGLKKKKLPKIERSQVMSKAIKQVKSESNLRERKTEVPRDSKKSFEEVKDDMREEEVIEGLKDKEDKEEMQIKQIKQSKSGKVGNEESQGVEVEKKDQRGVLDEGNKIESSVVDSAGIRELKKRESFKQGNFVPGGKMEDEYSADNALGKLKGSSRSSSSSSSKGNSKSKSQESKSSKSSNKKD